ncbi:MAG TPA: tRNA pseudouridine(38-40) synthase TruA [Rickettsiales bacterium]|nr:tRNA pseudouridine(38-40) synthase TruA [Rickettsiales bacterium]
MRYKIIIEYDGTNYSGWQRQKDNFSIQESIEKAIQLFSGETVVVYGCGRTDAGVHALGQVAHFDLTKEYEPSKVVLAINFYLKYNTCAKSDKNAVTQDITILDCEIVDENFHARFSAKKRYYKYRILNRQQPSAIDYKMWHIGKKLDFEKMQEALPLFIGKKDWTSFRDTECQAKSPIKTIDKVSLTKNGDEIIFEIEAKSFLHHMVRNIVGTLVDVGLNKITVEELNEIIEAKDRTKAGPTASPQGLFFVLVQYI